MGGGEAQRDLVDLRLQFAVELLELVEQLGVVLAGTVDVAERIPVVTRLRPSRAPSSDVPTSSTPRILAAWASSSSFVTFCSARRMRSSRVSIFLP